MKTPLFRRIMCCSLLAFTLFGFCESCRKSEPSGRESGAVLYFSYLGSSRDVSADSGIVEAFESGTGRKIVRRRIMPADIGTHRSDYLSGTQVPDLITWIRSREDLTSDESGSFSDISDLWKEEEWLQGVPEALKGASRIGESYYMVPFNVGIWRIYYRKSIFSNHNLSIPQNWDSFIDACSILEDAGITPVALGSKFRWPAAAWLEYINLRVNGSAYHSTLLTGEETFLSQEAKEAVTLFAGLIRSGFFPADTLENSWAGAAGAFESGTAAMYLFNETLLDSLSEEVRLDTGTFHFPEITPGIPQSAIGTVQGWVIPKNARVSQGARQFLRFAGSTAGMAALSGLPGTNLFGDSYGKTLDVSESADTILPESNRLASPFLRQPLYNAVARLLSDPSEETVEMVLSYLEQERKKIPSAQ